MQKIFSILLLITLTSCSQFEAKVSDDDYSIQNGILYLTVNQLTATDGLTAASEYCHYSKECSTVYLPFGEHKVNYNIVLLTPLTATYGTTLILSPKDKTNPAIKCERKRGFYVETAKISNINFVVESECLAVIKTGRAHKAAINYCDIDCNFKAAYGIILGDEEEKGSIGSLVNETRIVRANKAAVGMIETGGKHRFNECQFRQNMVGISMDRGMIVLQNSELDKNPKHLEITGGVSCYVSNCTFEGGIFDVNKLEVFSFFESKASVCDFLFSNIDYLDIDKSRMNATAVSEGASKVSITGNYWQPPSNYEKAFEYYCNEDNILKGNSTGRNIKLATCN
jgi:hypothetical protein